MISLNYIGAIDLCVLCVGRVPSTHSPNPIEPLSFLPDFLAVNLLLYT
ncbi:hypothetical protein MICAD_1720006 [Microcystis aeruginosa PCC 7941]|nr:hypothetical protein MICAD_1720006 [Microcystis aeruginosa PCC 7941]